MAADARISVVIPTYNRANLLRGCLDSALAQTRPADEIVLVDDGSTDDTSEVVASYSDQIMFIQQENAGPGAARNNGAARASGDYIAFLDSDDAWAPWTLEYIAAAIEEHRPRLMLLTPQILSDPSEWRCNEKPPLDARGYPDFFAAAKRGLYCGSNVMVVDRRRMLEVGGFHPDLRCAEDQVLVMRMGIDAGFCQIVSPPLVGVLRHEVSLMESCDGIVSGLNYLIDAEHRGEFPGGAERQRDRRAYLSFLVRGLSHRLVKQGHPKEARRLYRRVLGWNLRLLRFKYLLGLPVLSVLAPKRG
ncbi:putative glycosyltransferase EpsH [Posidoniimonas polymericola]|uniref:Putative glycosyltransferase EpsH n=1 Tax=Posidoniimonas polymericola TaxID=2528002 RepID=A0A5C5YFJ3_9BACT|nr:glycosyltransferase family A protein [Posidoniimonas polymericola]TWT73709.1 putative glycosyltransferase EpsH [Posidoniimonas polymericola]